MKRPQTEPPREFRRFVQYLQSPKQLMWRNFLAGIFHAFGMTIGFIVVFSVVIKILSTMVDFPLIGQYITELRDTLESFRDFNPRKP